MRRALSVVATIFGLCFLPVIPATAQQKSDMPWVAVSKDKKGFVLEPSWKPFVSWGFNYDHDSQGRLIEDYWEAECPWWKPTSAR